MSLGQSIKDGIERLRSSPGEELGRWSRFARFQLHLWQVCVRQLWENNLTAMSAALAFRTIFAMIPAIVLAILVLKSVGVLEDGKRSLRSLLDASGFAQISVVEYQDATASADESNSPRILNVADEIERVVNLVEAKLTFGRVGPVGIVLLVWTALSMISTAERSLNRIFGAGRSRSLALRLLLYWSVLTLGPLLSIAAAYAGRKLVGTFQAAPGISWAMGFIGWIGPILVGILVLAAVYKLLPNAQVRYRAALGGALISVPLWLVAKWGFTVYVTEVVGTGNLYGALGLVPLFLIWVNLSWTIFLFGAQLAFTAVNLSTLELAERSLDHAPQPSDLLAAALAVAAPYQSGKGPVALEQIASRLRLNGEAVRPLLNQLCNAGIICSVDGEAGDCYVPAKPVDKIAVLDVVGLCAVDNAHGEGHRYQSDLADGVRRVSKRAHSALGTFSLEDAIALSRPARNENPERPDGRI